jgi:alpha-1,3-rhamnosyl/mannosyltransferase
MPIVIDTRTATDHFPGIGRYVANLAQVLRQVAPDLNLSLLTDPSAMATCLTLPDLPHIACCASPFSVRQQWAVPAALRRARATLYHSPYYLMPYRPGVPTVLTIHDLIPLLFPHHSTAQARLLFRWAMALALRAARRVIAISEATRRDLLAHFRVPAAHVVVAPEAADPSFRPRPAAEVETVRRKYGLSGQYILYLGSNKPHKNLLHLVEAFSRLTPHTSHLVIAGVWDPRYPEVRQRAEALGLEERVCFLGPVAESDLPAVYSGATLFAFPSLYEGFGLPVLEAMACGAPVVCSNTSSLPEVAGDAALTFDPTSIDAIADALRRLLSDSELRAELRTRGLHRAAQFSWERTAQETLAVYESVGRSNGN